MKKILVKLQRIHKESITTNLQRKNYNEFTRTHVYDKSTRPAFLELQRIYKEIFTTNLQGNLYNEFTRKWLQRIYKDTCITRNIPGPCFPLRRIYYDYIWIPENQIPNPQSLLPITSYPFYPIPPFSHLSYFLLNPKLQLNP